MNDVPASFDRDALVSTGRTIHIRPSGSSDVDAMRAFYDTLSDDSLYRRFFHARPKLLADRLHPQAGNSLDRRVVLLALDGPSVVGVGEYWRAPSAGEAEIAFAVADSHQHEGIATMLLEDLAVLGRAAGLERLVAETLVDNSEMLDVFRRVGLPHRTWYDHGHVHVELELAETEALERNADDWDWASAVTSLQPVLAPDHVVVIGAGRQPGSPGRIVLHNLISSFGGRVSVVHPSLTSIEGVPAVRSVGALDAVPDLAVVAVPAPQVGGVVEDCGRAGVPAAVVISAGFAESGPVGERLQGEVLRSARRFGMRLVGPNCLGVVSAGVGLNATFLQRQFPVGDVSIASQSGGVGMLIAGEAARRRVGVRSFVSLGNKADVSGNDLLRYWADDPETRVVMMYLESVGDPERFARIARIVSQRVPLVALKSGRTAAGRRAARSHTAALAMDDVAVDALFRHSGVLRAGSLDEMIDLAVLLRAGPLPAGRRVAIVGNAGGPLILAADAAAAEGLHVVELSAALQARIRAVVPAAASTSNPVDLLATVGPAAARQVLELLAESGEVDACALVSVNMRESARELDGLQLDWADPKVPAVAVSFGWSDVTGSMPSIPTPERAMAALAKLARRSEWLDAVSHRPDPPVLDALRVRLIARDAIHGDHDGWVGPMATVDLLRGLEVPVVATTMATTTREACAAADAIGFPCVLKADVAGLVHKSDAGAVTMHVQSRNAVRRVVAEFRRTFGERLQGVLVQHEQTAGVELLIGAVHDPANGPLLVVAAGGTRTEVLADRRVLVAPAARDDIREALESLRMAPLLRGYRGAPAMTLDAVVDVAERIGLLIAAVPEITELDLNPVIVSADGCAVVDARIAVAPRAPRPLRRLRAPASDSGPDDPVAAPPSSAA